MKVLVCGARGFIGARVSEALRQAGHEVLLGVRHPSPGRVNERQVDFVHWRSPEAWRPALMGVDAVVNAVGVLRDGSQQPMRAIHAEAPEALFEACARQGVRRLIHVSALGIDGNPTLYARTKLAAEEALMARTRADQLDGVVLRPSIVFGQGGDSSQLFTLLARLPLLCLPAPVIQARVQPVAVDELALGIANLLLPGGPPMRGILNVVGPEALTLAEFIASLRRQMGRAPARVLPLPSLLSRWSARLGDQVPWTPWCTETLALLAQDNVAPAADFERVLGRTATEPDRLLACAA